MTTLVLFFGVAMLRISTLISMFLVIATNSVAPVRAQGLDPLNPIPGGATGANVVCLLAGDLNSGALRTIYWQSEPGKWQAKAHAAQGRATYVVRQSSEPMVDLFDESRRIAVQFDFARKRVKRSTPEQPDNLTDVLHILSATDKEGAVDCLAIALVEPPAQGAKPRQGVPAMLNITVKIGTPISIAPGTKLTATSGPPCPGQPDHFLCPNKFTCAPNGGVCCPGAGACAAGLFCDRFIANSCIGPGDPAFCAGTGNPVTGVSLHCTPGSTCVPGNFCVP